MESKLCGSVPHLSPLKKTEMLGTSGFRYTGEVSWVLLSRKANKRRLNIVLKDLKYVFREKFKGKVNFFLYSSIKIHREIPPALTETFM